MTTTTTMARWGQLGTKEDDQENRMTFMNYNNKNNCNATKEKR